MKADGSTSGGCWIYTGVYAGGINRSANRKPGREQSQVAPNGAGPGRPTDGSSTTAPPPTPRAAVERAQEVRLVGRGAAEVGGRRRPRLPGDQAPGHRPERGVGGPEGIAGDDPFIMQPDGKGWLFAPKGMLDGPLPTHYEPQESPVDNPLYRQQANPARRVFPRKDNLWSPSAGLPGAEVYPYVFTTYRLTEHHTAGGMSRWLPYSPSCSRSSSARSLRSSPPSAASRTAAGRRSSRPARPSRRGCWSPSG